MNKHRIIINDELREQLRQDILERYDNQEYWDERIIEQWFDDNDDKLKQIQRGETK